MVANTAKISSSQYLDKSWIGLYIYIILTDAVGRDAERDAHKPAQLSHVHLLEFKSLTITQVDLYSFKLHRHVTDIV